MVDCLGSKTIGTEEEPAELPVPDEEEDAGGPDNVSTGVGKAGPEAELLLPTLAVPTIVDEDFT